MGLPQDVREQHEHQSWEQVFGSAGWCEAPVAMPPARGIQCPCIYDGTANSSLYCSVRTKQFCLNDCSARGQCDMGFCRCDEGFFDVDCSQHVDATLLVRPPEDLPELEQGGRTEAASSASSR